MGNTMVCPTCNGAGFSKLPETGKIIKLGKNPFKACERCNGQGFIHLTH